jgi:hypothetical protein
MFLADRPGKGILTEDFNCPAIRGGVSDKEEEKWISS